LPKRALRGLLFAGGKLEAFKPHRGTLRFLADGPSLSLRSSFGPQADQSESEKSGGLIGEVSSLVVPQPGRSPATHRSRTTFSACLPFPVGAQAKANMKR
jgi:hypothetical protein